MSDGWMSFGGGVHWRDKRQASEAAWEQAYPGITKGPTDPRLSTGNADPRWRDPAVVARRVDPANAGSAIYFDSRGSTAPPPAAGASPQHTGRTVGGGR